MNHLKLLLCLWLVPLLPSKAQRLIYPDSIPVEEIRVSPDHAMGGNVSDYVEDIQYFKLEKPNTGWIEWIWRVYTVGGRLILNDNRKGNIYAHIYSNTGKLIKDNFMDKATVRHNAISFNVDNKHIYVSNPMKETYQADSLWKDGERYSLDGDLLEEFALRDLEVEGRRIEFDYYAQLRGAKFFFMSIGKIPFQKSNIVLASHSDGQVTPLLRVDTNFMGLKQVDLASNRFYTSLLNGEMVAHHSHPFSYEVVEISASGIDKIYKFVLPQKHTVPENIYELPEYKERGSISYFQDIEQNRTLVRGIHDIVRYKDCLLFYLPAHSIGGRYAYSLKKEEFINIGRLVPDESNGFMPLFSRNTSRLFSDGEYLYSLIYSQDVNEHIRDFYERNKRVVPNWVKDLANYDNPILVRFKLKS